MTHSKKNEVYIIAGKRTPIGSFMGPLSTVPAPELGSAAIRGVLKEAEKKAGIQPNQVQEVFMGNVLTSGVGQAPARQATIFSGLGDQVPATTVNKVCGSGMKAVILGMQSIQSGNNDVVIAGGMENMSMAPHLLMDSRKGIKFGESSLKDSMQWDGLRDVYTGLAMGNCAEECAKKYSNREEQDAFAIASFKKAQEALKSGLFRGEIENVVIKGPKGETVVSEDDGPFKANFEKIPALKPAFTKDGSITAANASTINDGASALMLVSEKHRTKAQFKIVATASHAAHPTWFTTAPVEAMKKVLQKSELKLEQIDLFEINEAFAIVTMAAIKELKLDESKVNIFGGAVSLGHPIGSSGSRIIVTLMSAMEHKQSKYGMASICIGGGEALAVILERL